MSFVKRFLSDKGSYPVIGFISAGVVGAAWYSTRHLLYAPDVKLGTMRGSYIKQDRADGESFYAHPIRTAIVGEEKINRFKKINESLKE